MHIGSHGGRAMIQNTAIQPGLNPQINNKYQGNNIYSQHQQGQIATSESFTLSTDQVTLSYSSESMVTYDSTMSLKGVQNDGFDLLRGLVLNIFEEQGLELSVPTGDGEVNLETITPEEASALVADDGYFGVEQTSDRIVDFAKGIAGGDPSRIDAIKAGVEQGFNEALEAFGGWLPDISYDTYDAVMEKLDDWVEDANVAQVS